MDFDTIVLLVNCSLYGLLLSFLLYRWKKELMRHSLSILILSLYLIMSVFSFFLYFHPLSSFQPLKLFPFLYLFICLLVSFHPLIEFDEERITYLQEPSHKILNAIVLFAIAISVLSSIETLGSLSKLKEIVTDLSIINDSYNDSRNNIKSSGGSVVLLKTFNYLFNYLYLLFLFFFLTKSKKTIFDKFVVIALCYSIIMTVLGQLLDGIRGPIIGMIFDLFFMFTIFRRRLSAIAERSLRKVFLFIIFVTGFSFLTITFGRFGEDSHNASVGMTVEYGLEAYVGQQFLNFNNYGIDSGGTREGDKTFPIVRAALGMNYSRDWEDRRLRYRHLKMDDSVFYTYVGDFTLDFGPYMAFILLSLISLFNSYIINKRRKFTFFQLIVLYILFIVCSHGFSLYPLGEMGGNRTLIFMLIIGLLLTRNHSSKNNSFKYVNSYK